MSLKAFHIIFVVISTILAVGFGIWAIMKYKQDSDTSALVVGIVSLAIAVSLIIYGKWFLRKLKGVSYL